MWITTKEIAINENFELPKIGDILVEEFLVFLQAHFWTWFTTKEKFL